MVGGSAQTRGARPPDVESGGLCMLFKPLHAKAPYLYLGGMVAGNLALYAASRIGKAPIAEDGPHPILAVAPIAGLEVEVIPNIV